ncbi:MAG: hypothetical protein RBS10_01335 [Thauera propionica]|jgi:hypothetical protein|nr:hypothetical protein [Thauera propionica]
MTDRWTLYQRRPGLVLGFHGTEKKTVTQVVGQRSRTHLTASKGTNEWLGHGIYFWENDPQRALEWAENGNAKKKIQEPDVVGAVLDLGLCLDLTTRTGLEEVAEAHRTLSEMYETARLEMPRNRGGRDRLNRELDCQVIQALHDYRTQRGLTPYDSVRSPFPEADELYEGAGFRAQNHIQIAIINPACIKGYFRPLHE